jgi:hypothetical protein
MIPPAMERVKKCVDLEKSTSYSASSLTGPVLSIYYYGGNLIKEWGEDCILGAEIGYFSAGAEIKFQGVS